jgi:hypothetical protein
MRTKVLTIIALLGSFASGWVVPAAAAPQPEILAAVQIDVPACACDSGYSIAVYYSVSGGPADGALEIYEDEVLARAVPLQGFQGAAQELVNVSSDTEAAHSWRAVLNLTAGEDSIRLEDAGAIQVCDTPLLSGVPDQTSPFHSFNLHDYLTYQGNMPLHWDVGAPYPPPPGWEISINYDATITVYAPEDTPYSMDLTFHVWVECGPGIFCVSSDTASFGPSAPPVVCPSDAAIDLETWINGVEAGSPPGIEIPAGSPVTWTYRVTNTGRVPLEAVTVGEGRAGTVCTFGHLAPGEIVSCETTGTAHQGTTVIRAKAAGACIAPTGRKSSITDLERTYYLGVSP